MDKEEVLKKLAEDALALHDAALRAARMISLDGDLALKMKPVQRLNSKIVNVWLDMGDVIEAGILSNESIESKLIEKQNEREKEI
jgi:hypothetical protein